MHDRDLQVRNRGGNVPIVLESNQNHAQASETEVCPTLSASMGLGGGYVPMIVVEECVSYLHAEETETCFPLRSQLGGGLPMVVDTLIFDEAQITSPANRSAVTWGGLCGTLNRDAGRMTVVIRERENYELSDRDGDAESRIAPRQL